MDKRIRQRLEKGVQEKVFPGAVVGVVRGNGARALISVGTYTYEAGSPHVKENTMYDTASITKTIPVGLIALKFIEEGKLPLEDQIIKYSPEITIPNAEKGLIKHLLTYTYMLKKNSDPHFSYEHLTAKDSLEFLFTTEFAFLPGTQFQYSNTPANLLGIILERISGEKLYILAQKIIFDPLEMQHSSFAPENRKDIPPIEISLWRGEIQGEVHDDQAYVLQKGGENPGCAGLFSSAGDLLNVAEMVLNKGVYKGSKIFDTQTILLMTTNALEDIDQSCAIGWELNQTGFMGQYSHEHMIGKTGFTGTSIVIDPHTQQACVLLSNRTYPKRTNAEAIRAVRRDIADIIFSP